MNMFGGNTVNEFNIQDDLDVDGDANIDGNLTVVGTASFTGDVSGVDKIEDDDASTSITTKEIAETLTFNTNSLPRGTFTSLGNFLVDTDTLYVDAVNDRVGINKIPSVNFDVAGLINTDTDYQISNTSVLTSTTLGTGVVNSSLTNVGTLTSLTVSGDIQGSTITATDQVNLTNSTIKLLNNSNDLDLYTSTTNRMTIESGGNVRVINDMMVGADLSPSFTLSIGDIDTGIDWVSDGEFRIMNNNSETMRFDSAGMVGIGNAAPSVLLTLGDDAEDEDLLLFDIARAWRFTGVGSGSSSQLRLESDTTGTKDFTIGQGSSGNTLATFRATDVASSQVVMLCEDGGRVGIGGSPETDFELQANKAEIMITDSDTGIPSTNEELCFLTFQSNQSSISGGAPIAQVVIINDSSNVFPDGAFIWKTGDAGVLTERMRLRSNGQLGIGGSSSSTTLFIDNGDEVPLELRRATSSTGADLIRAVSDVGGSDTLNYLVEANGNNFNTNTAYGGLSDLRYKENVVDCNSQWDDMKAIRFVNYNFIATPTAPQLGVIAQELELVSSGLIENRDDADTNGFDDGVGTKMVKTSILYMKGMKALQEAMTRIETLEAANVSLLEIITTMNDRITALET